MLNIIMGSNIYARKITIFAEKSSDSILGQCFVKICIEYETNEKFKVFIPKRYFIICFIYHFKIESGKNNFSRTNLKIWTYLGNF